MPFKIVELREQNSLKGYGKMYLFDFWNWSNCTYTCIIWCTYKKDKGCRGTVYIWTKCRQGGEGRGQNSQEFCGRLIRIAPNLIDASPSAVSHLYFFPSLRACYDDIPLSCIVVNSVGRSVEEHSPCHWRRLLQHCRGEERERGYHYQSDVSSLLPPEMEAENFTPQRGTWAPTTTSRVDWRLSS